MKKLEEGYFECKSYSCLKVLDEEGYCVECARIRAIEDREKVMEERMLRVRVEQERARKRYEEEQQIIEQRAAKWAQLRSLINISKLNQVERGFVEESVQRCIMTDKKLSDKQRAWLRSIICKYPAK